MAYDELRFLGDNFLARTYRQFFGNLDPDVLFTRSNFETSAYCNGRYSCNVTNLLLRFFNAFISAMTKRIKLPKFLVIVLDNDLTEFIKIHKTGVASILDRYVESMVTTIDNLIKERKRQLPVKAVKDAYPKVYWLAAPTHRDWSAKENNLRNKFNLCLESVVRQTDSMRIIRMKEIWSGNDTTLVKNDEILPDGLAKYWLSVDATIKFNVQ